MRRLEECGGFGKFWKAGRFHHFQIAYVGSSGGRENGAWRPSPRRFRLVKFYNKQVQNKEGYPSLFSLVISSNLLDILTSKAPKRIL